MRRLVVIFAMLLPGAGSAAECVWKDEMSAAEIEACRDSQPQGKEAEEQRLSEARREENAMRRQQEAAESAKREAMARAATIERARVAALPLEPSAGMTAQQFAEVRLHNDELLRAWQKAHPFPSGNIDGYDLRWGRWNSCTVNRTRTVRVEHEQWVCGDRRYVYVDNGIVTAVQE